ncbi:hypothetical protein KKG63_03645 [Patescibacteria group bacterium]|nr:hypothetical protein [Patescibacteria group bacterium]
MCLQKRIFGGNFGEKVIRVKTIKDIKSILIRRNWETRYNLQADWKGELEWIGITSEEDIRHIKNLVVMEVDAFRYQSWWRRLLNLLPEVKFFD